MTKNETAERAERTASKVHASFVEKLIYEIECLKKYNHCKRVLLFGSRSLGRNVPITSDWDIAAQADLLFEEELSLDGWQILKQAEDSYLDSNTDTVYQKTLDNVAGYPLKVQIVLKKDFDVFQQMWWAIGAGFYQRFIDKRSEHYMGKDLVRQYFNTLETAVRAGKFIHKHDSYHEKFNAMYLKVATFNAPQPIIWAEPAIVEGHFPVGVDAVFQDAVVDRGVELNF